MPGTLGCAQEYRASFHWRGGGEVYGEVLVDELTAVQWQRTANEVSDASITITRQAMSPECCELIGGRTLPDGTVEGGVEPWIHELTIYRDTELVWQGPVVRTVESKTGFTVEAMDVCAWLDRCMNTWRMSFKKKAEPDRHRVRGPVTKIAHTILKLNLGESAVSKPHDWAGILPYIVREDTRETVTYERDGSKNRAILVQPVGTILRDLVKRGLLFTTVGRSIVLRGKPSSKSHAIARLSLADIVGDVQLIRDGTSTATAAWATSQDQQDPSKGRTEIVGKWGTAYGRLDTLVQVQDAKAKELRQAARKALEGRYPAPLVISVPEGAQLSADAPVTVDHLVCGQRIDVLTEDWCTQVQQGFMLSDVSVSWESGAEKVAVSLVPLSDPYGSPTAPPDDGSGGSAPAPAPSPAPGPSSPAPAPSSPAPSPAPSSPAPSTPAPAPSVGTMPAAWRAEEAVQ